MRANERASGTPPREREPELPAGLVLFPPGTPPARRRRRLIFVAVYLAVALAITWPVYPLFSGIWPLILGLPLSLTWVIFALAVSFGALLWLYRSEPDEEPDPEPDEGSG